MNYKKIAKSLAPHLKYGDKPAIAKDTGINIRSVYCVFEGHLERVREEKVKKILLAAIKLLKKKNAFNEKLAKEVNGSL